MKRLRLWLAGLVAFLLGVPLTARAFGQWNDITGSAVDLGFSIANASDGGS